jgi:hypothetical protein
MGSLLSTLTVIITSTEKFNIPTDFVRCRRMELNSLRILKAAL